MKLLLRWGILALAIWATTLIVPGIKVNGGFGAYLWVALLFGFINAFLGSLLKVLTFPALILSFGLFSFVINAAMLELTSRWSKHLDVKDFLSALIGSLLISVISAVIGAITNKRKIF
jgi:putative membrane protein